MTNMPNRTKAIPPLSKGAQRALMKLALLNPMDPSTDLYGACGPFGRVLVLRGLAKADGIDHETKLKLFKPTALGKAEGMSLYKATAHVK